MEKRPELPALTGLRFFAAFYVVIYHYLAHVDSYPSFLVGVVTCGFAGVSLFFVLSGVVLTYNYRDNFRSELSYCTHFLQSRAARILPMYYVAFFLGLLLMVVGFLRFGQTSSTQQILRDGLPSLLLVRTFIPWNLLEWNPPLWSVGDEVFFYLCFPFLMLAGRWLRRARLNLSLVFLVAFLADVGTVLLIYQWASVDPSRSVVADRLTQFAPPLRLIEFLAGCVVGWAYLDGKGIMGWLNRSERARNYLILGSVGAFLCQASQFLPATFDHWHLTAYLLFLPLAVGLIAALMSGPTHLGRLLDWPPVHRLGEASYSLYVLHWLGLVALGMLYQSHAGGLWWQDEGHAMPLPAALGMAVVMVIASLGTYTWIEKPLRDRWKPKRRSQPSNSSRAATVGSSFARS